MLSPCSRHAPSPCRRCPPTRSRTASPAPTQRSPESTEPGSTPPSSEPDAVDPARQAWLDQIAQADNDTFAGGAAARDLVDGNRVIAIGDSLMASTARRYGGELCRTLVPDGWDVEVDAETGRFIDFGERVLNRRLDDGFDVAVIMLGNNYGANPGVFHDGLEQIVDELAPRPTVIYTVTLFRPDRAEVNDIIYDIAMEHDNVRVIDWQGETAKDPGLVGGDGLHLSDRGRARFAELLADELGRAPGSSGHQGECLSSSFTDDSATSGTGPTLPGQAPAPPPMTTNPSSGGGGGGGADTTAPATTAAPAPPATDGGGGGGGTTPPGPETTPAPQTTAPQVTTPQPTEPPPTTRRHRPPPTTRQSAADEPASAADEPAPTDRRRTRRPRSPATRGTAGHRLTVPATLLSADSGRRDPCANLTAAPPGWRELRRIAPRSDRGLVTTRRRRVATRATAPLPEQTTVPR